MATNADERELELVMQLMMNLKMDAPPDVHPAAAAAAAEAEAAPSSCGTRAEWAALLFDRMKCAADAGDAVARAAGLLEAFEGSVAAASRTDRDAAVAQNNLLKRAFLVQHRLLVAEKAKNVELQRQVDGCQDRVANLEKDKYALSVLLRQAQQQGSSMPGHFHPEVF
ncbi:hypothetical protein QOZ80_1AG0024060 [Eleusine coracana subsp. coracana]|nr:hypothetical protein QOZ80_1AG0024060 [Eleusine coracana subsp. coracana]